MVIISQKTVDACRNNYQVIGTLTAMFDVHPTSIQRWFDKKDLKLTSPSVLEVIRKHTGMKDEELLVDSPVEQAA